MSTLQPLTFHQAREKLKESLQRSSATLLDSCNTSVNNNAFPKELVAILAVVLFIVFLFAYSLGVVPFEGAGLVFTIVVLIVVVGVNFGIFWFSKKAKQKEFYNQVMKIIRQYEFYLQNQSNDMTASGCVQIPTGHSQISIVNVYRNNEWIRTPVLLLVQGDIIALMGGDITPCKVYELRRSKYHTSRKVLATSIEGTWERGLLLEAGLRILIESTNHVHPSKCGDGDNIMLDDTPPNMFRGEKVDTTTRRSLKHSLKAASNRYRSLGAENIDLLRLNGNIRCFEVATTPVETFIESVYTQQMVSTEKNRNTFIYKLRQLIVSKAGKYILLTTALLIIVGILRVFLLNDADVQYGRMIFLPLGSSLLFFMPVCWPMIHLFIDSFGTAEILTTLEVAFAEHDSKLLTMINSDNLQPTNSNGAPLSAAKDSAVNALQSKSAESNDLAGEGISGNSSYSSQINSSTDKGLGGKNMMHEHLSDRSATSPNERDENGKSNEDEEEEERSDENDEFVDEDLDDRVEDIAEETEAKVGYIRFFLYICKIAKTRLWPTDYSKHVYSHRSSHHPTSLTSPKSSGNSNDSTSSPLSPSSNSNQAHAPQTHRHHHHHHHHHHRHFLPIPLSSINLVEQLGSVNMVCFIDDDVICENYSVTEEIFLLTENHDTVNNNGGGNNMSSVRSNGVGGGSTAHSNTHSESDTDDFKGSNKAPFNPTNAQSYSKGTVLDLHANPQATGSRFENPLWWKYLPSLKPLGLNALLTYRHTAQDTNHPLVKALDSVGNINNLPSVAARKSSYSFSRTSLSGPVRKSDVTNNAPSRHYSSFMSASFSSPMSTTPTNTGATTTSTTNTTLCSDIEVALVKHVRRTLPLEFLRELSEEIGFLDEDIQTFTQVLESDVIAPGLENARLLEDNHQWGQEETRRRGSLMPKLRSAVYRDNRGGGLQMMSLGDPSLVLNYCREYWDGSTKSITPLSSSDRLEVLNVYERWRLEDFDVVGFCYSPMPVTAMHYLIEDNQGGTTNNVTVTAKKKLLASSGSQKSNASNTAEVTIPTVPVKFFVDPRTMNELIGGKLHRKMHRTNTLDAVAPAEMIKLPSTSMQMSDKVQSELSHGGSNTKNKLEVVVEETILAMNSQSPRVDSGRKQASSPPPDSLHQHVLLDSIDHEKHSKDDIDDGLLNRSTVSDYPIHPVYPIPDTILPIKKCVSESDLTARQQYLIATSQSQMSLLLSPDTESSFFEMTDNPLLSRMSMTNASAKLISTPSTSLKMSLRQASSAGDIEGLNTYNPVIDPSSLNNSEPFAKSRSFEAYLNGTRKRSVTTIDTFLKPFIPRSESKGSDNASNTMMELSIPLTTQSEKIRSGSKPPRILSDEALSLNSSLLLANEDMPMDDYRLDMNNPHDEDLIILNPLSINISVYRAQSPTDKQQAATPVISKVTTTPMSPSAAAGGNRSMQPRVSLNSNHAGTKGDVNDSSNNNNNNNNNKQERKLALRQLWSSMRQQIFLGMVASSVPVKRDVPNTKEDLDIAGIRFVYFSVQNMKRSKPIAEKIGIPFDWNCAISLRNLDENHEHDPHRHISNYADWDVLARMPHGIEAIRHHIKNVDNVPLLVSLFTDSTPETVESMLSIFRENGENVLAIGTSYRAYNQSIYRSANIATSISMLPNIMSFVPAYEKDLFHCFPSLSMSSLTKSEIKLSMDLVSLGTINLLQAPCFTYEMLHQHHPQTAKPGGLEEKEIKQLKLSVLLETIRKGRVLLLNTLQAMMFYLVTMSALALWSLFAHIIPLNIPPACPPAMAILFIVIYVPCICLAMLFTDDHERIMKTTPRKNFLQLKMKDQSRFVYYFSMRIGVFVSSIIIAGYFTTASVLRREQNFFESLTSYRYILSSNNNTAMNITDIRAFWLIQDMMTNMAYLAMISQAFTLLIRGQHFNKPIIWPSNYIEFYVIIFLLTALHIGIMCWRVALRDCMIYNPISSVLAEIDCESADAPSETTYLHLHYIVWIWLFVGCVSNAVVGFVVNQDDDRHYRRYLQFLRLEFDTRLGMHSPR